MKGIGEAHSRARTIGITAALIGGVAWMAKIVIMTVQGGPDQNSIPEAIAFFAGLLGIVIAAAAAGVHFARGGSGGWRVLAAILAVLVVAVVVGVGQALLTALPGDSWVREEAIFGIVGLFFVLGAARALRLQPSRGAAAYKARLNA
jgi:hypothetical protein